MSALPPVLLALAFIAVGVAAWLLGRRAGVRTVHLPRDYYIGLDHLINDRFDRAAEVLTRVAASNEDAAELQFALGSLFRKRGESDRAIAIHARLREHGAAGIRHQATLALARDFLGAGLLDRAEVLLEELAAREDYRLEALEHLRGIHEQQGDWVRALEVFERLPAGLQRERRAVAAHYLCELAEQAIGQGDNDKARALLERTKAHAELARAQLLAARMQEAAGERRGALGRYLEVLEAAPELALEVIPRVLSLAAALGDEHIAEQLHARLERTDRLTARQLAWLLAAALPCEDGTLRSLGQLLARMGEASGRYQCEACGLTSAGWFWRCPKCRSWDGMQPAVFKWAERAGGGAAPVSH